MTSSVTLAVVHIVLSMLFGIAALYSTKVMMDLYFKRRYGLDVRSQSYVLLSAVVMFCVGYVLSGMTTPVLAVLPTIDVDASLVDRVGILSVHIISYWLVGLLLTLSSLIIAGFIFAGLTEADELNDLREGNLPSIIVLSVVLIVLTLFLKEGYTMLLNATLPPSVARVSWP